MRFLRTRREVGGRFHRPLTRNPLRTKAIVNPAPADITEGTSGLWVLPARRVDPPPKPKARRLPSW